MNHFTPESEDFKKDRDFIQEASDVVGIDLKNPIDLSQMSVRNVSVMPSFDDDDMGHGYMVRKATLHAYIPNEMGGEDELTIEIELKSRSGPKRQYR